MSKWLLLLVCVITLCVSAFLCGLNNSNNVKDSVITHHYDTIFVYKYDTIRIKETIYKEKRVVDSIYVETSNNNTVSLPVVQKLFSKPSLYDIWISGVEPLNIDSAYFYNKNTQRIITNSIECNRTNDNASIFWGGGFYSFCGNYVPYTGVSITKGNKWLIEANFGLDRSVTIGAKYNFF